MAWLRYYCRYLAWAFCLLLFAGCLSIWYYTFLLLTGTAGLHQIVESDDFQVILVHFLPQCSMGGLLSCHHSADFLVWIDITVSHCPPPLSRSVVDWLFISVGELVSLGVMDRVNGLLKSTRRITRRTQADGSRKTQGGDPRKGPKRNPENQYIPLGMLAISNFWESKRPAEIPENSRHHWENLGISETIRVFWETQKPAGRFGDYRNQ